MDALDTGRFIVTHDVASLSRADTVSICVPTPLRKTKDPDLRYIMSAANDVAKHISQGVSWFLKALHTQGPQEIVGGALENRGFSIGEDVFVAFSPERVDPGNPVFHTRTHLRYWGMTLLVDGLRLRYECFMRLFLCRRRE